MWLQFCNTLLFVQKIERKFSPFPNMDDWKTVFWYLRYRNHVTSHTDTLALCSKATGFSSPTEGILINSSLYNSYHKRKDSAGLSSMHYIIKNIHDRWEFHFGQAYVRIKGSTDTILYNRFPYRASYFLQDAGMVPVAHGCQPMVNGANSMPTWEPPICGAVKKETFFCVKQLNCDSAQLWEQYSCETALGPGPSPTR